MRWKVEAGTQRDSLRDKLVLGTEGSEVVVMCSCHTNEIKPELLRSQAQVQKELGTGEGLPNKEGKVDPRRQTVCKEWGGLEEQINSCWGIWKEKRRCQCSSR